VNDPRDEIRKARVGTDEDPPCEVCGNAVDPQSSLCQRCQRLFALERARPAYEAVKRRERERERAREAM